MLTKSLFIPYIDAAKKNCLTAADWQIIGINALSYRLDVLLEKSEWLELNINAKQFLNWPSILIINANLKPNKSGNYSLTSTINGKTKNFDAAALIALYKQLSPDYLIIPASLKAYKSELEHHQITALVAGETHQMCSNTALERKSAKILEESYILEAIIQANSYQQWFESSIAIEDAIDKKFYRNNEIILLDEKTRNVYQSLDEQCICPICSRKITQAYLTHLIEHTPLLAQRYLIQHNNHYCQNWLDKRSS